VSAGWLLAAAAADLAIGDPPAWPHPVTGIAKVASALERRLPRTRAGGAVMLLGVAGGAAALAGLLPLAARRAGPGAAWAMRVALGAWALSGRSLAAHAEAVARPLAAGDLPAARAAVSRIVGRDTQALDGAGIARAAIESVAESASDGYIAPAFWLAVGGPAAAWAYKAVNTLDSIYGHKDERNLRFGWAAARMDDLLNLVPARLTASLIALASGSPLRALAAVRAGARAHPSPNAGHPEAAMAGGLGVRLGGRDVYGDEAIDHPVLAPWARAADAADIRRAIRCFAIAGGLGLAILAAVGRR
jgi:adenosylcobinamide-phosphate synthase